MFSCSIEDQAGVTFFTAFPCSETFSKALESNKTTGLHVESNNTMSEMVPLTEERPSLSAASWAGSSFFENSEQTISSLEEPLSPMAYTAALDDASWWGEAATLPEPALPAKVQWSPLKPTKNTAAMRAWKNSRQPPAAAAARTAAAQSPTSQLKKMPWVGKIGSNGAAEPPPWDETHHVNFARHNTRFHPSLREYFPTKAAGKWLL
jgi:hypothetical protein